MADSGSGQSGELGNGVTSEKTSFAQVTEFIHKIITRRTFLEASGTVGLGAVVFSVVGCSGSGKADTSRQVFVANALGMVVADATRCVGCRRCESACVAWNDGKVQPSISRLKVNRNLLFGTVGVQEGLVRGDGIYGNFRVIQDTCRQCPHPVPCQVACPHGAIEVLDTKPYARVVNKDKCKGCGICVQACPVGHDVAGRTRPRREHQGDQVHVVRRQSGVRGGLPCGRAAVHALGRPDQGGPAAPGGACVHSAGG